MKSVIFLLFLLSFIYSQAQTSHTDSARIASRKMLIRDIFWASPGDPTAGWLFIGPVSSFEMNSASLGGEVKFYGAYYDILLSMSAYANSRHLYNMSTILPNTAVSAGFQASFLALEGTLYLGAERNYWFLTPKIGADSGSLSVFYGFGFPLENNDFSTGYRHSITIKYALDMGAFRFHKMRMKNE